MSQITLFTKISKKDTFFEQEELNKIDIYNEHIMLGLQLKMVWLKNKDILNSKTAKYIF